MENKEENSEFPKEIKSENENINPLLDIISNLQEKLDLSNQNNNNTYNNQNNNIKYTNNLNESTNTFNANKIFEMFGNINGNQTQNNSSSYSNPFMNLDMDTMMRVGKIFSSMNREDPRKDLLLSLKPFLRDSRQKNVDTYVFLIGILNVIDSFNNGDSGFNG